MRQKKLNIEKEPILNPGQKSASTGKLMDGLNLKYTIREKLYDVKEMIDNHVEDIHSTVTDNVKQTIKYIQRVQQTNEKLMKSSSGQKVKLDPSLAKVRRLWDQVAAPDQSESDFDVSLNYQPETDTPNMKLTDTPNMKLVKMPRLTRGEELEIRTMAPPPPSKKPKIMIVDTKLERFRRGYEEYGRSVNNFLI